MAHMLRGWLLVAAVLLTGVRGLAIDYLVVFHPGERASFYDLGNNSFAGSQVVGQGAFQAFGISDPIRFGRFLRIFIITNASVVALDPDPPFAVQATFALNGTAQMGERSARLSNDGSRLFVLAGRQLHIFDTVSPANPSPDIVDLGGAPVGWEITPDDGHVVFLTLDSNRIRSVTLTTSPPALLGGFSTLPTSAFALAQSPNGTVMLAGAPTTIHQISPRTRDYTTSFRSDVGVPLDIGFDSEPPVRTAFLNLGTTLQALDLEARAPGLVFDAQGTIQKYESPGQDLLYVIAGSPGRLYQATISSGAIGLLDDPLGGALPTPAVDFEFGPGKRQLYAAFGGTGTVRQLTIDGSSSLFEFQPDDVPTGIDVLSTPPERASTLEVFAGDGQFAPALSELPIPLTVLATATDGRPVFDAEVTFSSTQADVRYTPEIATTNLYGVASTVIETPVTTGFTVNAIVRPGNAQTSFEVNPRDPGPDGLFREAGDYQIVEQFNDFPRTFVVKAQNNGIAVPGLELTVDVNDFSTFSVECDEMVTTNGEGIAEITCLANGVGAPLAVRISVTDPFGRTLDKPFDATVVPFENQLPRDPDGLSTSRVSGIAGTTVEDAISIRALSLQGLPVFGVGVAFTSDDDVSFDPQLAPTDQAGIARTSVNLGCELGDGIITATMHQPDLPELEIPFTTMRGAPALIIKTQGDNQSGDAGTLLNGPGQALRAVVRDACGNATPAEDILWSVFPPGAGTLENEFQRTNGDGEISALVRLGDQPGPFEIRAQVGAASATFTIGVNVTATRIVSAAGDNQSIPTSTAAPVDLTITLQNNAGQPASGIDVNFSLVEGDGTLTRTSDTTDTTGAASTGFVSGNTLGRVVIRAEALGLTVDFTLTVVGRMPEVTTLGFVNAASFGVGWTPGSLGTLFGVGLMEEVDGVVLGETLPLPTTLQNVTITVNGVPAPLIALANINGQEQINLQVPFETPVTGDGVSVVVDNNGAQTTVPGVRIVRAQPGLFEFSQNGETFVAALHADFSPVTPANPARPGEVILLFITGAGPILPQVATNQPGPSSPLSRATEPVAVTVAGNPAAVFENTAFYAPGFVGLFQVNVTIPESTPTGNAIVVVTIFGAQSQTSNIPVQP